MSNGCRSERTSYTRKLWSATGYRRHPLGESQDHVILDNLTCHKTAEAARFVAAAGAEIHFPPPYGPDLNSIERMSTTLKSRSAKARTFDGLIGAFCDALRAICPADILGWLRHDGYQDRRSTETPKKNLLSCGRHREDRLGLGGTEKGGRSGSHNRSGQKPDWVESEILLAAFFKASRMFCEENEKRADEAALLPDQYATEFNRTSPCKIRT